MEMLITTLQTRWNQPSEYEPPEGTQEAASKNDAVGNNSDFNIAGSNAQNPNSNAYVSDDYRAYNPQYGQEQDTPVWTLAQLLPHIVRPGMRHGALPEDRKEDTQAGQDHSGGEKQDRPTNGKDDGYFNTWSKIRHYLREPLAEWLGVSALFNCILTKMGSNTCHHRQHLQ
jgi:aquaglyceroporin related protein